MPYKDPEKQREAVRLSRARNGSGLAKLAEAVQGAGDLPEPPTRDFLLRALGIQAREGNVPAIRLLLEEYRRDSDASSGQPVTAIEKLARLRAA